jgi:poly(A) polymerase
MDFPPFIRTLKARFDSAGRDLYAVGGCVRDRLLGRPVDDYDLTTDAPPEEVRALAAAAGPDSLYAVGEKFGTIGAIWDGTHVEITTYRGEQYEPGSRKPNVRFSTTLDEDLARRDFTINAIAEDLGDARLIDPFGGSADLHNRLVRAVDEPADRFRDDPLRLMRAVRYASALDFAIEEETAQSIAACAGQLEHISRERVRDELSRMLTGPAPDRAILLLAELGLLERIVPELVELRRIESGGRRHKDVFTHTLQVLRHVPADLVTRWAALLHDIGKPRTVGHKDGKLHFNGHEQVGERMARTILTDLRYDRPTIDAVARIVGMHTHVNGYSAEWTDGAVRRLVREAGSALQPLLDLSRSDITSYHTYKREAAARRIEELQARIARLEAEAAIESLRPPLDGTDLMRLFDRPPGPWIRPIKDHLLEMVIDGTLAPDDRETAERIARELGARSGDSRETKT